MSISITLPDDADDWQLSAAADFFAKLAKGERLAAQYAGSLPEVPCGRLPVPHRDGPEHVTPEERQAVTAAVEQIASTIAADQFPDVPEFPSAAEAFGATPPVSPPLPTITAAAAAIGIPTPPPAAPGGVELDKHGLPWDKRIHSSSKATNADGSWRKRKGLNDDAMVARVEAELRAALSAPAAPPAIPQPPTLTVVPSAPFVPPPVPSVPPPVAASPSVPAAPAGSAPTTLPLLMQALGPHLQAGRVTVEHINKAMANAQLPPGLPVLGTRPDLIPSVYADILKEAGVA